MTRRKFTTPEGLQVLAEPGLEHTCHPLHIGGKLIATCKAHYGQQPALRNGAR